MEAAIGVMCVPLLGGTCVPSPGSVPHLEGRGSLQGNFCSPPCISVCEQAPGALPALQGTSKNK